MLPTLKTKRSVHSHVFFVLRKLLLPYDRFSIGYHCNKVLQPHLPQILLADLFKLALLQLTQGDHASLSDNVADLRGRVVLKTVDDFVQLALGEIVLHFFQVLQDQLASGLCIWVGNVDHLAESTLGS